jgi:preprotein translocase YajC subunit
MTGGWYLIIILVLLFGMSYFLMIRPMRQREKAHDRLIEEIEPGDTVLTAGGIYGEVEKIDEDSVVLKVHDIVDHVIRQESHLKFPRYFSVVHIYTVWISQSVA